MIRQIRKARIAPGKQQEAIKWAKELRYYNNPKYGDRSDAKVFLETLGENGVLCFMVDFKDLATLDSLLKEMYADLGFQEREKAVSEIFMPAVVDKVYESID